MILSAEPDLLIADEATSALDAVVRHRILDLIEEQVRLRGMEPGPDQPRSRSGGATRTASWSPPAG